MDGYHDLRLVLGALRDGRVDPARLAEVGLGWTPDAATPFWKYLVERGVVPGPNTTVSLAPPVPNGAGETPSFAADGSTPSFPEPINPARDTVAYHGPGRERPECGRPAGVARYEVLRSHRAGGLGEVWLARDTTVGRDVALKTLRPDRVGDPDTRARFVREARVTGRLEHPCVVPLYDLIEDGDSRGPSYVMRFVSGRTLAEAAADYHAHRAKGQASRLELAALLDAFVAVCRAVAFAHARGVLHRDLKGQNVVLGDFGEVFLIDWGLAKPVGEADTPPPLEPPSPADPNQPTRSGAVVGTPAYMAPEVAAGGAASKASDIYGLGAVLYALLTGRPPYDGGDPWEVVERVIATDPPPPRAVNPAAPPALEAVCRKAMARDPASRYGLAEELATEVRRWLADEPVAAYRDPWTVRATRWARRHRTTVAAVSVFLLTALVALGASTALVWNEQRQTDKQKRAAEDNFGLARDLSFNGLSLLESREVNVAAVPGLHSARKDLLLTAARVFDRSLAAGPDDPSLRARSAHVYRLTATVHRLEYDLEPGAKRTEDAVRLLEGLAGQFPDEPAHRFQLAAALRDRAVFHALAGRLAVAAADLDRSVGVVEALRSTEDRPDYRRALAIALLDRAGVEFARGGYGPSEAAARRSAGLYCDLIARPPGSHPSDVLLCGAALSRAAAAQREAGRIDEARQTHADAVKVLPKTNDKPADGVNAADQYDVLARSWLERARTFARSEARRADAGPLLEAAAQRWDGLARAYPEFPAYRLGAATARRELAELRRGTAGREGEGDALLDRSREALEAISRARPGLQAGWAELGRTYAALGRAAGDRGGAAADWFRRSEEALNRAVEMSPDDARDRQTLEAVRREQEVAMPGRRP